MGGRVKFLSGVSSKSDRAAINEGYALHRGGMTYAKAAKLVGRGEDWLRRRLDPAYRDARNTARQRRRQQSNGRFQERIRDAVQRPVISDEKLKILRAMTPEDSRDTTGKQMGDPLPGRSALDQRGPQ
jgi:hypothetical protein